MNFGQESCHSCKLDVNEADDGGDKNAADDYTNLDLFMNKRYSHSSIEMTDHASDSTTIVSFLLLCVFVVANDHNEYSAKGIHLRGIRRIVIMVLMTYPCDIVARCFMYLYRFYGHMSTLDNFVNGIMGRFEATVNG